MHPVFEKILIHFQQKQLSTKKEEAEKKEELPAEEDVIDETYDPILHLNAAPEVDNSFDVSNTDLDEDEEEVDGGAAADSTPRGVIYPSSGPDSKFLPAGGGDRIPSTPVPSKLVEIPSLKKNSCTNLLFPSFSRNLIKTCKFHNFIFTLAQQFLLNEINKFLLQITLKWFKATKIVLSLSSRFEN